MEQHANIHQTRILCTELFCSDAELAAFDIAEAVRVHRRAKQRRKLIADVEDHIGDLHGWPFKEQLFVLNEDAPSRGSVFRFILFALGNRAPPIPLASMLIGLGKLPTLKKRRDAWDAMRNFRDGTLRSDAFYWDMEAGHRVDIHGPTSWCAHGVLPSMRDPWFWAEAEHKLTNH